MIIGIDPGKQGAVAILADDRSIMRLFDMPETPSDLATTLRLALAAKFAVVEDVSSMTYVDGSGQTRGQGAKASFNFGKGVGEIHGVLAALGIPIRLVKPAVWKSLMGLTSDKRHSLAQARLKFPSHVEFFKRAKDDGRAEAALIALFGAERFT